MLSTLWRTRDRPPIFSGSWCRAWAKRLQQSPQLLRQARAQAKLRLAGAAVSPSAFFSNLHQISGQLHQLTIGPETFIGRVEISVHAPVTIGRRVCINDGAKLLSASHDVRHPNWPTIVKPIVIGDYAWIATNALILPGVNIGEGAVVGAGAVVTRDVPAGRLVAGNPATLLPGQRSSNLDYSPTACLALFTAWSRMAPKAPSSNLPL
jgi:maltose O-acetyltransferase